MKNLAVIHCADTYDHMDIGAADIDQWHRARGWSAIGYAYVIRRDGMLELGRDLDGDGDVTDEVGAHAAGFNRDSIGICLVGGKGLNGQPQYNFTKAQMHTLHDLILNLEVRFPGLRVCGHCDLTNVTKACPVFDVSLWLADLS